MAARKTLHQGFANFQKGNYTMLPHLAISQLSGGVAKRLAEYILKHDDDDEIIRISELRLIGICNKQPHFSHYKRKLLENLPKIAHMFDVEVVEFSSIAKYAELKVSKWKVKRPKYDEQTAFKKMFCKYYKNTKGYHLQKEGLFYKFTDNPELDYIANFEHGDKSLDKRDIWMKLQNAYKKNDKLRESVENGKAFYISDNK